MSNVHLKELDDPPELRSIIDEILLLSFVAGEKRKNACLDKCSSKSAKNKGIRYNYLAFVCCRCVWLRDLVREIEIETEKYYNH